MTLIERIVGLYRADIEIVTDSLVINSWQGTKTVEMAVELACEGDALLRF